MGSSPFFLIIYILSVSVISIIEPPIGLFVRIVHPKHLDVFHFPTPAAVSVMQFHSNFVTVFEDDFF